LFFEYKISSPALFNLADGVADGRRVTTAKEVADLFV